MSIASLSFRILNGLILTIAATQSWAGPVSLVQVTGEVGFSCTTGTGGFEQYCVDHHIETGTLSLVYDSSIPDSDHSEHSGLFRGTIRSFEMTVSQVNRPALSFSLVGRGDIHRDGLNGDWFGWSMILKEENGVVEPSLFWFGMYQPWPGNPNEMPSADVWPEVIAFGGGGAGVNETDWLYSGNLRVSSMPTPIPAPPSIWLLLIGAAGALLQSGRLRKV